MRTTPTLEGNHEATHGNVHQRSRGKITVCWLQELSATLDTYVPKSADLFRAPSANNDIMENGNPTPSRSSKNLCEFVPEYNDKNEDLNLKGIYSTRQELGGHFRSGALQTFGQGGGGVGPNGLTKKQELMVRSAIKYWVERHKHVVR